MSNNVFSMEILYSGKYESWEFENRQKRDVFYEQVVQQFADQKINGQEEGIDDTRIVQLSSNNLKIQENGEYAQDTRYEWFEYDVFSQMLDFINNKYNQSE
ncbi:MULTISPECIES: hypothetical protein [Planococcus]|uniref:Uncharacterized protein n=1 Tax=Planococcus faecalis TaxID=1598147 RepID=A0ABN4XI90_9BACL|nr:MULTISPECIES: hypothetical protein [Planococcus]AQU79452.1 hypothetical protein AJGP001_09350 [Planococcus faecalis]KAA0956440.1 hypothetical protein FQ085_13125 [Planococcus sp. ANT_H30]MDJ0332530.1 hypothetical protein [Planococcus sp. S3-L1]OHX51420.1 hypothetical protein BB777_03935 [Planococcus faecalis]